MTTDVEDFLSHYGVRGQKWGHRKSKYFAPTTKEERKVIRRSSSAHEGQRIIGKIAVSVGVGITAGTIVGTLVRRHAGLPVAKIAAGATSYAGTALTLHILDANGKRKVKSLNSKRGK